jgi:ABC-type methionine transport system ATPase subunit
VFQGYNLLPRANLHDNVALPLIYSGVRKSERDARAQELLERVGLSRYLRYMPADSDLGADSSSAWPSREHWSTARS